MENEGDEKPIIKTMIIGMVVKTVLIYFMTFLLRLG